jgi:hypothetical protein
MLKTITKFVVERRRLVRQRRQQVIEEGDSGDPAGHSEVPQHEGDNGDPSSIRRSSNVRGTTATPQGTPRSRRNLPSHNSANRPRPRFGAR